MLVLHANWMDGALQLWGEALDAYHRAAGAANADTPVQRGGVATLPAASRSIAHPFAIDAQELRMALTRCEVQSADVAPVGSITLQLPCDDKGPWPSERLARAAGTVDQPVDPWLADIEIPCLVIPAGDALPALLALDTAHLPHGIELSQSVRYWCDVARLVIDLLADQRFIPAVRQPRSAQHLAASWQPWLHDDAARARIGELLRQMPPVVRAIRNGHEQRPWPLLDDALRTLTDSFVRTALQAESFHDAIADRDAANDLHVAWLGGLLGGEARIDILPDRSFELLREAHQWIARLDDTGQGRPFHLCLRLNEPTVAIGGHSKPNDADESPWLLTLHLQSAEDEHVLIDAASLWSRDGAGRQMHGHRIDHPQELLLSELARASRVYPRIESALGERDPSEIVLNTPQAYEFLRDIKPVLEESGFAVIVPAWWDQPMGRLAARLHVEPIGAAPSTAPTEGASPALSRLGLNTLVQFRWQVAVGDQPLSAEEFSALLRVNAPLVQVRGRWVEISPDQLLSARKLLAAKPTGQMTLLQAIHLAHGAESRQLGVPVTGMDATGWIADVLNASTDPQQIVSLDQPVSFVGTLRPYQRNGLSWLAFLDRFGLGACLADDMGLGKTIQLIALLLYEREAIDAQRESATPSGALDTNDGAADESTIVNRQSRIGPTLLVVPTSVVGNWTRELARFAPLLKVQVHHGPERESGEVFVASAGRHDVVITTYPLIARDVQTLRMVSWHRVALDEAQYIKNPPTKQTQAIRSLHSPHRLALTGTPVENRLSELWSIMEFCNPGYLGAASEFRRRFSLAIERRRDPLHAEQLKRLVRPFILRRVKTDPNVISDLPPCVETKEYATLTAEQAAMYQKIVNSMLGQIDRSEGMQRRGLVLSALVRLKQICNHPAQLNASGDDLSASNGQSIEPGATDMSLADPDQPIKALSHRSGKCQRLVTMLEEVLATGEKALIFTQFRRMGHILTAMIQNELDCEVLFLHGGTPVAKRQHLIDRFQASESGGGGGGARFFVLSLKAGGLGLNLTAANHVFHFDRWWNPAVENQATDRAFRIGQTRPVHVHKFVCVGTLEERIDQMIESKTELATNIIGSGEQWLTELSTTQLHDLLRLRPTAVEGES
jgi:SNF2 family DNA or RNA helicase